MWGRAADAATGNAGLLEALLLGMGWAGGEWLQDMHVPWKIHLREWTSLETHPLWIDPQASPKCSQSLPTRAC